MNDTVNPFELQVGGPDGITNADVPVRWCITPEFVSRMEKDEIRDPHILLVSVDKTRGDEMSRHLVPVGELMTYVRFTRAGRMKLYGWIIDGSCGRRKLHDDFLGRTRGQWNTNVIFNWTGEPRDEIEGAYVGTERDVVIPANVFGNEPPRWLKWYANLWHAGPVRDQCEFRKRVMIGIPKLIPVAVVSFLLVALKVAIGSLFTLAGWRHSVQWRYAWRPFKYGVEMILNSLDIVHPPNDHQNNPQKAVFLGDSDWWCGQRFLWWRKLNNGDNLAGIFFLPFTPLLVLSIFGASWLTTGYIGDAAVITATVLVIMLAISGTMDIMFHSLITVMEHFGELWNVLVSVPARWFKRRWRSLDGYMARNDLWPQTIATAIIVGVVSLVTLFVMYWDVLQLLLYVAVLVGATYFVSSKMLKQMDRHALDMNDPTRMRELLCPADQSNMIASYAALPVERRSLGLKFKTIKNRVCRPMQM